MVINYILLISYSIGLICILFSLSGTLSNVIEVFIVNIKIIYSIYAPSGIMLNGPASSERFSIGKGAGAGGSAGRGSSTACVERGASGNVGSGSGSGAGASGSAGTGSVATGAGRGSAAGGVGTGNYPNDPLGMDPVMNPRIPPGPNNILPTHWNPARDSQGNFIRVTYFNLPMTPQLGSFTTPDPNNIGQRGFEPGNNKPYCGAVAGVLEAVYNGHKAPSVAKNMPLLDSHTQAFLIS